MKIRAKDVGLWGSNVANDNNPYRTFRPGAVNYSRCTTKRGSGKILLEVSKGSKNGGVSRVEAGFPNDYDHDLWSTLLDDGLIACVNGRWIESTRYRFYQTAFKIRAIASYTREAPRYVITSAGQKILDQIIARENKKNLVNNP